MKLKKLFSVALSVLLIVALAGCGGTKDEIASTSDKTTETGASELLSLYDSISTETKYVAMSDLPEIAAKESYTIGVAMTDVSTGWFKALYDHVNEKLTEAGVTVNLVQCNDDAAMQVDQINTFIAQGVDAIIINPANPQETVTSALDDCAASGIPVVAVDTPPETGSAYMTACVTFSGQDGGHGTGHPPAGDVSRYGEHPLRNDRRHRRKLDCRCQKPGSP